jgi:hypothetical protein
MLPTEQCRAEAISSQLHSKQYASANKARSSIASARSARASVPIDAQTRVSPRYSRAEDLRERLGANLSALANIAYDARFNPAILLRPAFDSMRSDSRFTDLQRRIGIAQPAQAASSNIEPSLMVGQAM